MTRYGQIQEMLVLGKSWSWLNLICLGMQILFWKKWFALSQKICLGIIIDSLIRIARWGVGCGEPGVWCFRQLSLVLLTFGCDWPVRAGKFRHSNWKWHAQDHKISMDRMTRRSHNPRLSGSCAWASGRLACIAVATCLLVERWLCLAYLMVMHSP